MLSWSRTWSVAVFVATAFTALGCGGAPAEGVEVRELPAEVRRDYAVFADRCSKCHSLARPLNASIYDEEGWRIRVARMRAQPTSGISEEDERAIVRFLVYYSRPRVGREASRN
jgi:hypothetical protein